MFKLRNLSEILTCIFKFRHNKKTFDCGGKKSKYLVLKFIKKFQFLAYLK